MFLFLLFCYVGWLVCVSLLVYCVISNCSKLSCGHMMGLHISLNKQDKIRCACIDPPRKFMIHLLLHGEFYTVKV